MSAGAPWSVKGIDPKAREVAKDLARRSGMTLGEWLNRVILEDDAPEALDAEPEGSRPDLGRTHPTDLAIQAVEHSVRHAMARLDAAAGEQAGLAARLASLDARVEALSTGLSREVEGVRAEIASRLSAAPAGDVQERFAEMALHIHSSERRSREAVERMGREVIAMAEAVSRRLNATEERSAEAIDLVGTEIARIAGAVEARLARAEHTQADALQRLGAEVGRVTERFGQRLDGAERRSADAIQGVGDQVARLTEQLELRHDRASNDFVERIRQSEARTAAILETAAPAPAPRVAAAAEELFSRAEPESAEALIAAAAPRFGIEDLEAADGFAPIPETDDDIFAAEVLEEAVAEPAGDEGRPLSTREVIEQARATARAKATPEPVAMRAKVDARAASGRLFNGFGQPKPRRASTGLHTAMMVAGGAAFLSVGAAGVVLMENPESGGDRVAVAPGAPRAAVALAPGVTPPPAPLAAEAEFTQAIRDLDARRPGALGRLKALADQGHASAQLRLADLYGAGEAGVIRNPAEMRRWTALAAEAGLPKAMHNLGVYYFRGDGGPQDFASAAQWFRKAAELGVVESQYNLAMMHQAGSGVRKDLAEARRWFGEAAARGDEQARRAAQALGTTQPPAAQAPASPRAAAAPPRAPQASQNVAATQKMLARLGYYDGPIDARASEAYETALAEFRADRR